MATDFLTQQTLGAVFSGQALNDNWERIEAFFKDLGPWVISGLVPSAGVGLSVSVSAGVALFNGRRNNAGAITIGGLTNATTNHLYLLKDGTGTSNTTGTAPADSVKLGTAVTAGGVVTSVQTNWTSGRQTLIRHELFVHGSGAGHPRAVDLASWHATNNEGNETKGVLPSGALPSGGALLPVTTQSGNYTALSSDYFILVDASGANRTITLPTAVGITGKVYVIKKIDSSVNTVTIDANGSQTIDGALTVVIATQYESYAIVSDNANWHVF